MTYFEILEVNKDLSPIERSFYNNLEVSDYKEDEDDWDKEDDLDNEDTTRYNELYELINNLDIGTAEYDLNQEVTEEDYDLLEEVLDDLNIEGKLRDFILDYAK